MCDIIGQRCDTVNRSDLTNPVKSSHPARRGQQCDTGARCIRPIQCAWRRTWGRVAITDATMAKTISTLFLSLCSVQLESSFMFLALSIGVADLIRHRLSGPGDSLIRSKLAVAYPVEN